MSLLPLAALLSNGAAALYITPQPVTQVVVSARPIVSASAGLNNNLFPASTLIADTRSDLDECFANPSCKEAFEKKFKEKQAEKISPAKQKILDAKKAAADKAGAGGYTVTEGKAIDLGIKINTEPKDPFDVKYPSGCTVQDAIARPCATGTCLCG